MKVNLMIISSLLIAIIGFSCKNNSPSSAKTDAPKTDSVISAQKDTSIYRLVILFYSIGNGVESEHINAYEDSIGSFSQKVGKPIDYRKTHWGREGETDFILRLNELNPEQQAEFVTYSKSVLSKAKWVNIYENFSYRFRGK